MDKNVPLRFGMYKGFKIGLVYAFDPGYIDWCYNNKIFSKEDIEDLIQNGVVNQEANWQTHASGMSETNNYLDLFESWEELIDTIVLDYRYSFFEEFKVDKFLNTDSGYNKDGYPLVKFPFQIRQCYLGDLKINKIQEKNEKGLWMNVSTDQDINLYLCVQELILIHNNAVLNGGGLIFTENGIIEDELEVEFRKDLRIGTDNHILCIY